MARKKIVQYDRENSLMIHADLLNKAREEILAALKKYHIDFPLKVGLLKEELRSRNSGTGDQKLFNYLIGLLIREKIIVQEKEILRMADHQVTLAEDQEKIRRELNEIYLKGGLQPPYFKEVKGGFKGNKGLDILQVMVKDGELIKVKEDLFFHRDEIDRLQERLVTFLRANGEIDTPRFKEMTGASRKYTIPLLEYFDRTRLTLRLGDHRVLREKKG